MSSPTCGICGVSHIKYKCPACKAPSCSLPCFKQHESTCSALSKQVISSAASTTLTQSEGPQQSTQNSSLDAEDLKSLFIQYPSLKGRLQQIYLSTQEPSEALGTGAPESNTRPFSARPWRPEKGFHSGLKSMQAALDSGGPDAEGIAAFMNLLSDKANRET